MCVSVTTIKSCHYW